MPKKAKTGNCNTETTSKPIIFFEFVSLYSANEVQKVEVRNISYEFFSYKSWTKSNI